MRHTALSNAHASRQEGLMHFRHTAVFAETPAANQGNHLQAKFAMWQCPSPFFFGTGVFVKAWTVWLDTLTHHQGQFPQTSQRGHGAMAVIGHPQRLTTLFTALAS